MIVPVGTWRSWTAEEVLLIFCPPGPEPLRKLSASSPSGIFVRGRFVGLECFTGFMAESRFEVGAEGRAEVGLMV